MNLLSASVSDTLSRWRWPRRGRRYPIDVHHFAMPAMEPRPFNPVNEARVMAVYEEPGFWRGAAETRNSPVIEEWDAAALVRLRTIERELRAGRPLAEIAAFKEWHEARFKEIVH